MYFFFVIFTVYPQVDPCGFIGSMFSCNQPYLRACYPNDYDHMIATIMADAGMVAENEAGGDFDALDCDVMKPFTEDYHSRKATYNLIFSEFSLFSVV